MHICAWTSVHIFFDIEGGSNDDESQEALRGHQN